MKILFIMDPIEDVQIHADTTFALMRAAQASDHTLFYCTADEISAQSKDGNACCCATAQKVTVQNIENDFYQLGEKELVNIGTDFDAAFMRTDPPFDADYLHVTQFLQLAENDGCTIVNRPVGLQAANEKLYALHFPDVIPDTIVTSSTEHIKAFLKTHDDKAVIKPVDGHGGAGIFVITTEDKNLNAMIEVSTRNGQERIICQSYLPEARKGDKRILLLDGAPLGAILRVPRGDEHRGNIHAGGSVERSELTENDRRICDLMGPKLRDDGLFFVGLDVIGNALTEVNVTSPTGIQEMSRLDNVDYSARVFEWLELYRTSRR